MFFSKVYKYLSNPEYRFLYNCSLGMYKGLSDEEYLKRIYEAKCHDKLDLVNPKSFNEKLNWLKIFDRKELYTTLADKFLVKRFVSNVIGSEYVVTCLGCYEKVEDIEWSNLPERFIIKATHDSSGAYICNSKKDLDIKLIKKRYTKILNNNHYYLCREWPYKNIKPRIIIDEFLEDGTAQGRDVTLRDYKFWCFNGIPRYMYCTVKDKEIYENFYDMNFEAVDINHGFPRNKPECEKPQNFKKMVELAGKLAKASETYFVRIDFFNVDGKIYFGEFTFYDWAGLRPFAKKNLDIELGELIRLPID